MRALLLASTIGFVALTAPGQSSGEQDYKPRQGFVPDQATAIRIAVAVWEPIYGRENIARQAPYTARLAGETWEVEGSLPPNADGGVALARISKADGRILRVSHGR